MRSPDSVHRKNTTDITSGYEGETYDIVLRAFLARLTLGLSPSSFGMAVFDWLSHYLLSPAKQLDMQQKAAKNLLCLLLQWTAKTPALTHSKKTCPPPIMPRPEDQRFKNDAWNLFPYNVYSQAFLLCEQWLSEATTGVRGVSKHHERIVNFSVRQFLDMLSPSNFAATNPEVIAATLQQSGNNFIEGYKNLLEDFQHSACGLPAAVDDRFTPGKGVAITEGHVVYRNELMELIQYTPNTASVSPEPVLIVPAWIMKYYILDLSPKNSLVKYLVDHGHTVFMISWKNPDSEDRNISLEDYREMGIMQALRVVRKIVPGRKVHATGYCLGGTLLMIAAAAMAQFGEDYLKSITLFAAQIDFRDPGELSLFIDQSQVSLLEDIMWERGYLDGSQMAGAFSMLRSNDLIWSRLVHDYLLGKRRPANDLMAWNADTTRLPYRMHSEYLHQLFLNNELIQGRYRVKKKRIALVDIKVPIFAVGTVKDHVSPWRSVYKIHLFTHTDITFVLTSGGHNAGIVSEPGHAGRSYRINVRREHEKYIASDTWLESTPVIDGSWWPAWEHWLSQHSKEKKVAAPSMGFENETLGSAPGQYVLRK